jgi:hypothetical protein
LLPFNSVVARASPRTLAKAPLDHGQRLATGNEAEGFETQIERICGLVATSGADTGAGEH